MAQNIDLRKQSSVPTTPADSDKITIYANASGQLSYVNSNGTVAPLAGSFTQNISQAGGAIATGVAAAAPLGYYGSTGVAFLGVPNQWLVAVGSSGQKLVIPAYTYTS